MTTRVVRIERGEAAPEELAAITTVLLARAATTADPAAPGHPRPATAHWRRSGYLCAHSWQS
ncbi:acyl-CoA carboxylase epsilon subunit [Streptomyces sp. NBC_00503]|uniref:acyl-CoA carboxylase epsilon subunit n=1 Tax=Streptomyces sp. NBC_00503 TaxID=2903659 RepID=UPI002E801157|nr:acyl-CoA carboxylase epsilon subunit [Streptomyces sp. NBC_00503]WUD86378.1 acyl-CoA carboxylase subunit epsilon [Streptomyces sp. NBC_00503]